MNLKMKIKKDLKNEINNEKKGGKDLRILNYYDLKEGEKMKVLLIPDVNGELWTKFKKHGPNLKLPGAGSVNCAYTSSGDNCPACQKGFDLLNEFNDTGDKAYKEEAKRWFARDYTIVSVIVLESPIEVNESEDHNQVKIMYLPYAMENMIKETVSEGQIDQDDIPFTPLVIKKTKNAGGWASYENSYFAREKIEEEDMEVFDDMVVEQYDYSDLDIIPPAASSEDVAKWLEKAEEVDEKAKNGESTGGGSTDSGSAKTKENPLDRINKKKEKAPESEPEEQEEDDASQEEEAQEEEAKPESKPQNSALKDRLKKLRK